MQAPAQRLVEREHQGHVAAAVKEVKGNTADPVAEPRIETSNDGIGDRAQGAVAQSERPGKAGPHDSGVILTKQTRQEYQQGPSVEIVHPPDAKAVSNALQKDKRADNQRRELWHPERVQNQQQGHSLNIWKPRHNHLQGIYDPSQKPGGHNMTGRHLNTPS